MVLVEKRRYDNTAQARLKAQALRRKLNYCTDIDYEVVVDRCDVEIYRKGNLHYE